MLRANSSAHCFTPLKKQHKRQQLYMYVCVYVFVVLARSFAPTCIARYANLISCTCAHANSHPLTVPSRQTSGIQTAYIETRMGQKKNKEGRVLEAKTRTTPHTHGTRVETEAKIKLSEVPTKAVRKTNFTPPKYASKKQQGTRTAQCRPTRQNVRTKLPHSRANENRSRRAAARGPVPLEVTLGPARQRGTLESRGYRDALP